MCVYCRFCVFFFNDTATTEIYTLSLHDALPISVSQSPELVLNGFWDAPDMRPGTVHGKLSGDTWHGEWWLSPDRKSTRLNSSHANISYAVFCLKKKKHQNISVQLNDLPLLR